MLLRGAHSERDAAAAAARGAAAATAEEAAAEVQGAGATATVAVAVAVAVAEAEDVSWVLTEGEGEGEYATDGDELSASNGAGKTTLAMAALWALTGSTDARAGGKPIEARGVINEASARAAVTLRGTVRSASQHAPGGAEAEAVGEGGGEADGGGGGGDGCGAVAFEVVRVMGRREHTLRLTLGSEEYSGTLAQVQSQLDQVLRAEHLGRVCFFGQVVTMTHDGY